MSSYAIKYFRDAAVVAMYLEHGIVHKPVGYVIGKARFPSLMRAQRDADHINKLGPRVPVTVVPASG